MDVQEKVYLSTQINQIKGIKTGWKEVNFLIEALFPSPTPLKKKGGDYEYRNELNYIRRTEYQLNVSLVMVYKTPVTEVICNGFGEVKCHPGFYSGESRYMGVESI